MTSDRMANIGNQGEVAGIERLRQESLAVLKHLLREHTTVAFIDFPRHPNFGDSVIWWGTETYLRQLRKKVVARTSVYDFDPHSLRSVLRADTALLFHGGGNLGDLYPHHDNLRREVIKTFPERTKIVLPQSLFVQDEAWSLRARHDYASRNNVTVLLRDEASLERAREVLPESDVRFCYDLALGAPVLPAAFSGREPLVLSRRDSEKVSDLFTDDLHIAVSDWHGTRLARAQWRIGVKVLDGATSRLRRFPRLRTLCLNAALPRLGLLNCHQAVAQLQGRRAVATDRLHAHILSSLLGVPNFVTDNSYGKVSEVFRYSQHVGEAHWCTTLDEAARMAVSGE